MCFRYLHVCFRYLDASLGAYAKLLTADTEQVNSVLRGERLALEQQLREEPPDVRTT